MHAVVYPQGRCERKKRVGSCGSDGEPASNKQTNAQFACRVFFPAAERKKRLDLLFGRLGPLDTHGRPAHGPRFSIPLVLTSSRLNTIRAQRKINKAQARRWVDYLTV